MGPELLRLKDRHDRDYVVQPTSEEVITDLARQELKSYKQLPKNFYQIQTKFRDERRPRFGLMRAREFIMKDAYSFDRTAEAAQASYETMRQTYRRIFDRFGLRYRAVAADSGAIGGDLSEEFQVIASTGEDAIVYCPNSHSNYAANIEKAYSLAPTQVRPAARLPLSKVATPTQTQCEEVAAHLDIPLPHIVKTVVYVPEPLTQTPESETTSSPRAYACLVRADHDLNEIKLNKLLALDTPLRLASATKINDLFGCPPGFIGPVPTTSFLDRIQVIADREVIGMADFVCGANEPGFHLTGVNWGRDLPEPTLVDDIRNVVAGDLSPDGQGELAIERGIEVGHVFYLGTKYSQAMKASFLDENGQAALMEMGCYGIGISRLPAAAIEQNHDAKGIIWPDALAPFTVVLCPIGAHRSPDVQAQTQTLYQALQEADIDVIWDDRGERPGAMFADWELIGIPHRLVLSDRHLQAKQVEYQSRRADQPEVWPFDIAQVVNELRRRLHPVPQ
jgi:prolyl-tRNA synthetase